jgi:hypothetical protein
MLYSLSLLYSWYRLNTYERKQIGIAKEEKLAHEKEMRIHEEKMHKLNEQVKELDVSISVTKKDGDHVMVWIIEFQKKCSAMIIDSGRVALIRQQHAKAVSSLEMYNEELTQLEVKFNQDLNLIQISNFQEQTINAKKRLEASESTIRLCAQKIAKAMNQTLISGDTLLG